MRGKYGFIFILFFICSFIGRGIASGGKIAGTVFDKESGEALAGVNIIVESIWRSGREIPLETPMGASTDLEGYFVILNVPPGTYSLRITMIGFADMVLKEVRVNIDRTTVQEIALESTILETEEIRVVAEREVIKKDVSGTQEIIVSERLDRTPVMRVDEFINQIKGVNLIATNDGQGLSIRGGAIRETDVRIDGISLRDPRSENSYLSLNSTSVEELQVLTGGFEAKYGGIRSGLVNVVTKEGQRDRYNIAIKVDYTPSNQRKFFGENPWGTDSWIYKIFADTSYKWYDAAKDEYYSYAMNGLPGRGLVDSLLPEGFPDEFKFFRGWGYRREGLQNYEAIGLKGILLNAEQKRQLWMLQHPLYEFADEPDMFLEGSITGPLPGGRIPFLGSFLGKTTFLLGGKYEDTQFAFPIGPKNNYVDWNTQLKVTTMFAPGMKLTFGGMYAKMNSITAGRPSTFGGALIDNSSRFNFLSNNSVSVEQQAGLLGGSAGFIQMFNRSRLQFYNQRYIIGGAKFTHTLSPRSFYSIDLQTSYTDFEVTPYGFNPQDPKAWAYIDSIPVLNVPTVGSPNASTNWMLDMTNFFWLYGGLQAADSSYSWSVSLKGDYTSQLGRHHQVETGFSMNYYHLFVNTGTWLQSEKSWTPDTWQYFTVTPVEIGIYAQDKLEFEGMIANIGLRADYFNANKDPYLVSHPLDQDYANFYNLVYQNLSGEFGSWEKWVVYRDMLDQPEGWPTKDNKGQFKLSPRLGVSFPITDISKLYFNYGHFYQRPNVHFLYNQSISPGSATVPSTDLDMARTVAYEFGYEQSFLKNFLVNISFYYKDIKKEPLSRTFIDYYEELYVNRYFPDRYRDIRGLELRLEKNIGRFFTFWGNYEYMLQSSGSSGLAKVYENRLKALEESRNPNLIITQPHPRGNLTAIFQTPKDFGPLLLQMHPLGSFVISSFFEWRDGGEQILNPQEPKSQQKKIEVVDYSNIDLRASKMFSFLNMDVEFVMTIQNLLNQKRLSYWNMSTAQYDRYKESLHLPYESGDQKGNDKLGEWDKDHIDIGWFTAPLFLNPRRVLLGFRFNF